MTVAEYLARKLSECGIRHVFGIPGGPSIPYIEAFRSAGIEFIITSHEASAGIMADVSARLSGIPGVCHSTTGPGATNLTTGCGGAFLDRSPVIVTTSEAESDMLDRTAQMNIDHQQLFRPITKATFRISCHNIGPNFDRALKLCQQEYPGPVHLGFPSDIALAEAKAAHESCPEKDPDSETFCNDLEKVVSLLRKSKRPLIAAGLTLARFSAKASLLSLLDRCRIPVVLTPMAKGLISEDHPCYLGVLSHALSNYLDEIIRDCDLIIGLGYDPVEYNYESWMPCVPVLHFNTIPADLPLKCSSVQYIGNPDEWFTVLGQADDFSSLKLPPGLTTLRTEMASSFQRLTGHFGPVSAMKALQEAIPAETDITIDVGSHLHLFGQYWKTNGSRRILMTNGWSGMGFGVPAALAASLTGSHSKVVCITGDGGFLMTAGELLTARRYNLPVIIVVLSDGELNLIRLKKSWQEKSPYGTILYDGDLFGSGIFLGVKVISADSEKDMHKALNLALSANGPVIINARIDPGDYDHLIVRR